MRSSNLTFVRSGSLPFVFSLLVACHGGSNSGAEDDAGQRAPDGSVDSGYIGGGGDPVDAGHGPTCGDGMRHKPQESCDDGNILRGDGCDDQCHVEAGYKCAAKGGGCAPTCGDGLIVGKEQCDDGNTAALDGCSQDCKLEEGWTCPEPKKACVAALCGDGFQVGAEQCDDMNENNGDGCSVDCKVEAGWICVGATCTAAKCGDGIVAGTERCDDHNTMSGDGCLADCSGVEPYFVCPPTGGACTKTTVCGDGIFTADEGCDDGNNDDGDGCHHDCSVESGWTCAGGTACSELCGDGMIVGTEQCDDGQTCQDASKQWETCTASTQCGNGTTCGLHSGDGCSATCQLETGANCTQPGAVCGKAVCGNGVQEGLEECDDTAAGQVDHPYDGCYQCKREPSCSSGGCTSVCGDGIKFPDEVCDDGNTRSGDGCSADCTHTEPGWSCTNVELAPPNQVNLPLILRDFKGYVSGNAQTHIDFENLNAVDRGIVQQNLGLVAPDNKPGPLYNEPSSGSASTHGPAPFNQWYHDSALGKLVIGTLTVTNNGSGTYVYDDRTFYPLDGKGWQDTSKVAAGDLEPSYADGSLGTICGNQNTASDPDAGKQHNFSFTSEVRFWFTYEGGEKLRFRGDDDVFVFIASKLVIDLGGVHCAQESTVTLSNGDGQVDVNGDGTVDSNDVIDSNGDGVIDNKDTPGLRKLGLVPGNVYEVVVYQAERHTDQSSYRLELGEFFAKRTQCVEICGDGIRTKGELCDSGSACVGGNMDGEKCQKSSDCTGGGTCTSLNDGAYGHCTSDCKGHGPYCGDDAKQTPPEQCDLGAANNTGAYNQCNPNCTLAPFCGDGNVDGFWGEQCDLGTAKNTGGYGGCEATCRFGARCGDGVVQKDHGEQCDDKSNDAVYNGCAPGCVEAPSCGDGVVQAAHGEQCDLGTSKNTGAYGGCQANCTRAPFCGDGHVDAPQEECDDQNSNDFDGCSSKCKNELVLL